MKAWIHSTPLWKQQSSGQDPSFSRHSPPCSLSFPLRSLLFGDPWRTPSLAAPPLARSSRLSFFRRFIPYGSGLSPQNLSNEITQVPASESQPTRRISKRNCSRSKRKSGYQNKHAWRQDSTRSCERTSGAKYGKQKDSHRDRSLARHRSSCCPGLFGSWL